MLELEGCNNVYNKFIENKLGAELRCLLHEYGRYYHL